MKKTYKKIARRTCFYLLFATTCWFVACLHEDGRHIDFEKHYELMSTRSLRETGIPDCFFAYSDTARFGHLIPILQQVDSCHPFVDTFRQTYGLPLWNCSWLEKGELGNICFVPILPNDGRRQITTVWVFTETEKKILYTVVQPADNPNNSDWRFLSDFMTYRVFGTDNETNIVLKIAQSPQTRIAQPIVITTCNDIYTGTAGHLEYRYTDCFDHIFWIEEPEKWNQHPDPGEGSLSGSKINGGSGGGSSSVIGGQGDNEQPQNDEPRNPANEPCGRAERMSLDNELIHHVETLFEEVNNYHNDDLENGWIKTSTGEYISPAIRETNKVKYNESLLKGMKITEQYHSHPAGSCIPSWADLKNLAYRYSHSQIDVEHFSYGIVTTMGCLSLVIMDEKKFAEFVKGILDNSSQSIYNSKIIPNQPKSVDTAIARFIDFLNDSKSGISVLFNYSTYNPDSDNMELKDWYPMDSDGHEKLKDVFCLAY